MSSATTLQLKAGSSNHIMISDISRLDTDAAPGSYGTVECRILLASDDTEVVAAITMTKVDGKAAYECTVPDTAALVAGTAYRIEVSCTIDTDKKRLLVTDPITATRG